MNQQILPTGATVTLIHLTVLVDGTWCLACMPRLRDLHATPGHPNYQRTDDVRAVTCPACKRAANVK